MGNELIMTPPPPGRNPWPIAIVAFFAVLIAGIVGFITFATRNQLDLVRADYYAEEIQFQRQLDRLNRTRSLAVQATIAYDAGKRSVSIALPLAPAGPPTAGRIHFYRPSDATLDREVPLAVNDRGVQRVDARRFRPGLWKVRVQWTAAGQEYFFDQSVVVGQSES